VELVQEKHGRGEVESGGVLHHGTYEEDGPVTWEALSLLGRFRLYGRRAGYPSPKLARLQAHVPVAETLGRTSACPQEVGRWPRGTGAAAEGGKGVGGPNMSFDVGELVGDSDPAEQRRPVLM
jgi:hypothetical protein